jgi:preprotein translocase subunit SecA
MTQVLTPTCDRWMTEHQDVDELPHGLDGLAHRIVGMFKRRPGVLIRLLDDARLVDEMQSKFDHCSDRILRERLAEYRSVVRRGARGSEEVVFPALAALREVAHRQLGMRPYVVQLAGSLALHRGYLAELVTGEGKTLAAGLTAVLEGWRARPCHIVTANDYLAQRDAGWIGPLYRFCGLTVGYVSGEFDQARRREAYSRDIAYTTSKELVADFLRDRLILGKFQDYTRREALAIFHSDIMKRAPTVLRGLHTAIIDEADHILIDEAVTPVIISGRHENAVFKQACSDAAEIAGQMELNRDFTVDHGYRTIELSEAGEDRIAKIADRMPGLWKAHRRAAELITQALEARHLYENGKEYVVQDDKIIIVDEFTGRLMHQRTWREGLHQAVEVKEGLDQTDLTETSMRLSFQKFFRFFRRLSGMSGTAREAAPEFWAVYRLPFVSIPTNRPLCRTQLPAKIFASEKEKWQAVVTEVRTMHENGRPILVGVRTVRQSEHLSRLLGEQEIKHAVLNAVRHREEAQIIAGAGDEGQVTIATNMAGRGTDIVLGRGVAKKGGLHVLATEYHEAGRIDRQLYGRSGRQGDPGSSITFASLDDELLVRYVPRAVRIQLARVLSRDPEKGQAVCRSAFRGAQWWATGRASRQRKQILKVDTWLDESLSFSSGGGP